MDFIKLIESTEIINKRMEKILRIDFFELTPEYLQAINKYLLNDIIDEAGEFRKTNITKKERILKGKSVPYSDYHMIKTYLLYDMLSEKEINYEYYTLEEKINNLAHFTVKLWRTHPFYEANTRTICVFIQKYMQKLGLNITNDIFKDNAEYFRNSLVKASYYDINNTCHYDYEPLILLYKKALMDDTITLDENMLTIKETNNKEKKRKLF